MGSKQLIEKIQTLTWKKGLFRLWIIGAIGWEVFVLFVLFSEGLSIGLWLLVSLYPAFFLVVAVALFYIFAWGLKGFGLGSAFTSPDKTLPERPKKKISFGANRSSVSVLVRIVAFAVLSIFLWSVIILADAALNDGQTSFPGIIITVLSLTILYRRLILKKSVQSLFLALVFYISCNAIAVFLAASGQPSSAQIFAWGSLIGLGLYFLIIKPFIKGWREA